PPPRAPRPALAPLLDLGLAPGVPEVAGPIEEGLVSGEPVAPDQGVHEYEGVVRVHDRLGVVVPVLILDGTRLRHVEREGLGRMLPFRVQRMVTGELRHADEAPLHLWVPD